MENTHSELLEVIEMLKCSETLLTKDLIANDSKTSNCKKFILSKNILEDDKKTLNSNNFLIPKKNLETLNCSNILIPKNVLENNKVDLKTPSATKILPKDSEEYIIIDQKVDHRQFLLTGIGLERNINNPLPDNNFVKSVSIITKEVKENLNLDQAIKERLELKRLQDEQFINYMGYFENNIKDRMNSGESQINSTIYTSYIITHSFIDNIVNVLRFNGLKVESINTYEESDEMYRKFNISWDI